MKPFLDLSGPAAPLAMSNIDTDKIIPGRFLKTITREGLGAFLFYQLRYDESGAERDEFILNREPWRCAKFLVTLNNFGSGSSREHAPWSLMDFGIRCIIAPSFADIFYANCFKNGILPVTLDINFIRELILEVGQPHSAQLRVSLPAQTIFTSAGREIEFRIDEDRKRTLIEGLDDITRSLQQLPEIEAFEALERNLPAIPPQVY